MLIINCQKVKKYYGANLILDSITFELNHRERVGLVGRNGSGKSTLLRLIAKLDKPDEGQLMINKETLIGYLAQIPVEWETNTVYEILSSSCRELLDCQAKMAGLEQQMANPSTASDTKRIDVLLRQYADLQARFENEGGYELDARIDQVANGLKIEREWYGRVFATMSGGEQTKIGLASQLIGKPGLLLLDEPTNHLDLAGVEWLEGYLSKYEGACLIVSHDRYFLDLVATKIIELEDGEVETYHTNYTGYLKEKEAKLLLQFADYQEQQKQIRKMKETIKQLEDWGRVGGNEKFFRRAGSMQKALDRIERLKRPVLDPRGAEFEWKPADRSGRKVITFEGISKSYDSKLVLKKASGLLEYGEKVMLLGSNGSGKTTLFKLLLGEETAQEGTMEVGARVDIGYLAQQEYRGDEKKSVLDYFREEAGMEEGEARSRLARYLFYGTDVFKSVSQLSGGESTRLRLALLVLRKPNLLLLDEPTNHMDIASREALEEALEEYPGTLLAITHDRYFINRLAGKIWELDQGSITVFLGDFDAYKEKSEQLRAGKGLGTGTGSSNLSDQDAGKSLSSGKLNPKLVAAMPPKRSRPAKTVEFNREQCEREIASKEEQLAHLDLMLQEQATDSNTNGLELLWNEREEVQGRLNLLYKQWMEAENSNH